MQPERLPLFLSFPFLPFYPAGIQSYYPVDCFYILFIPLLNCFSVMFGLLLMFLFSKLHVEEKKALYFSGKKYAIL